MARISSTGRQFIITVPKDLMVLMEWNKDTDVIISKYPDKNILYIEQIKKSARKSEIHGSKASGTNSVGKKK